jgi:hypothetical protein
MKTIFWGMMMALAGTFQLTVLAQSDPGPPTGGGINRSYDDGFVYVDFTGGAFGYTSFWGYQDSSQIAGSFLSFHSESYLDANTIQLITDSYDISGLLFPPPAPYSGSASGFGPVIPDAPFSRTIEDIAVPEPALFSMFTVAGSVLIGRFVLRGQNRHLTPIKPDRSRDKKHP